VTPEGSAADPLLRVERIVKHFPGRTGLVRGKGVVHALDDITVELHEGEALGLVGESGSGKSTLASLLMLVERPTAGRILYRGRDIFRFSRPEATAYRREAQIVFQDTLGSLNPRMTVGDIIGSPGTSTVGW
jgi:oligopeptide transport system ATP-binding protein